jgi:plastocyanin
MKNNIIFVFIIFISFGVSLYAGNIKGKVKAKGVRNPANAVVYIEKIPGKTFAPPKEAALMDQKDLTFIPHVLPVLVGTKVDFLNSDDVLHNVFSPDECVGKFNLGSWPKGQKKSYVFKNPCVVTLLCNVHPEMGAYILVLETPYFAVTDKEGNYEIKNVPAGNYTLKIWHEKLKGNEVSVTVPEKGNVEQDFSIRR